MRRLAVPAIVLTIAIAFLAVLAFGVSHQGTSSSLTGEVARGDFPVAPNYDLALPVLGSRATESLRDMRGKVVLLNVFASWCQPCQAEAPVLEQAERIMASHGGTVVGITYQDNQSNDMSFVRQYHLTFPILRDIDGSFASAYRLSGVPDSYVINRQGRILALSELPLTSGWIHRTLPKILAERA